MSEREQKRETLHLRLDKSTMRELEDARLRIASDPKLVGLAEEITLATVARMMIKQGLAAATRAAGDEWDREVLAGPETLRDRVAKAKLGAVLAEVALGDQDARKAISQVATLGATTRQYLDHPRQPNGDDGAAEVVPPSDDPFTALEDEQSPTTDGGAS